MTPRARKVFLKSASVAYWGKSHSLMTLLEIFSWSIIYNLLFLNLKAVFCISFESINLIYIVPITIYNFFNYYNYKKDSEFWT